MSDDRRAGTSKLKWDKAKQAIVAESTDDTELSRLHSENAALRLRVGELEATVRGEQEARLKLDAAYRAKDAAMGQLITLCQSKGIDLSEYIP